MQLEKQGEPLAASLGSAPMLDGASKLFATIGHPVAQIRMPLIMPRVFEAVGLNAVWLTLDVAPQDLKTALDGLRVTQNFIGMSIAIPHKPAMLELCTHVTDRARAAGAVNLARFGADGGLVGDMLDGLGFVLGLKARGIDPSGKSAWIVGIGGAGAAVAAALAEAGVERLFITDLDVARVEACISRLKSVFPKTHVEFAPSAPRQVDIAMNCSPCGLQETDPLPFDPVLVPQNAIICDAIMKPPITTLLQKATDLGRSIQPGRYMLDYQIDQYLRFFGIDCELENVLAAID